MVESSSRAPPPPLGSDTNLIMKARQREVHFIQIRHMYMMICLDLIDIPSVSRLKAIRCSCVADRPYPRLVISSCPPLWAYAYRQCIP